MELPDASGSSLRSGRSLIRSSVCLLGLVLGATACMQPPTQITVNANSSADKTNTNTENYSSQIDSKESSSLVNTQAPPLPPARTPAPVQATFQASAPSTPSFGTCYWNGAPEQCSARWAGQTATVTWTSDGKVTRYNFAANTVYDSVNGRTYQATTSDIASGCISTANGTTCIYR